MTLQRTQYTHYSTQHSPDFRHLVKCCSSIRTLLVQILGGILAELWLSVAVDTFKKSRGLVHPNSGWILVRPSPSRGSGLFLQGKPFAAWQAISLNLSCSMPPAQKFQRLKPKASEP